MKNTLTKVLLWIVNVQASWNINQYQQNKTIKTYQDPTYSPPTSQLSQSLSGKTPATPKGSRRRPASQANTTGSNLRLPRLSRAFLGTNATSSAMSQLSVSCKKSKGHLKRALYYSDFNIDGPGRLTLSWNRWPRTLAIYPLFPQKKMNITTVNDPKNTDTSPVDGTTPLACIDGTAYIDGTSKLNITTLNDPKTQIQAL